MRGFGSVYATELQFQHSPRYTIFQYETGIEVERSSISRGRHVCEISLSIEHRLFDARCFYYVTI